MLECNTEHRLRASTAAIVMMEAQMELSRASRKKRKEKNGGDLTDARALENN